ncbi:unnamed protein product [Gadus morhua 'NCC']
MLDSHAWLQVPRLAVSFGRRRGKVTTLSVYRVTTKAVSHAIILPSVELKAVEHFSSLLLHIGLESQCAWLGLGTAAIFDTLNINSSSRAASLRLAAAADAASTLPGFENLNPQRVDLLWALWRGASLATICKAAPWSAHSRSPDSSSYRLNVAVRDPSVTRAGIGVATDSIGNSERLSHWSACILRADLGCFPLHRVGPCAVWSFTVCSRGEMVSI